MVIFWFCITNNDLFIYSIIMSRTQYSDAETKDLIMLVSECYKTICCTGKEFDKVAAKRKVSR